MLKLAVVGTVWYRYSHVDVIVRRWLEPDPARDRPRGFLGEGIEIASLYLDQFPENDLGRALCQKHNIPLFESISHALTLGGDALAVDGVLLIAEHGEYPINALWQKEYPRKAFFDEIVAVFEAAGRVVPIFCDKHFSYDPDAAEAMWASVQARKIPWLAGSSIPLVGFRHEGKGERVAPPFGKKLVEGVATFRVGPEIYGFHSLEVAQAVLERRPGGEAGVASIQALVGESVFAALEEGEIPRDLLEAALAAEGKTLDRLRERLAGASFEAEYLPFNPIAFRIERRDGPVLWHLCLQGVVEQFGLALREESGALFAGVANCGDETDFFGHFAALNAQIEKLMLTGSCDVPPERTHFTTLTIAACMRALQRAVQGVAHDHHRVPADVCIAEG